VSPPTLEVRDPKQEVEAFRIEYECGILSPQTWSQRRGLDFDQEQMNLKQCSGKGIGGSKTEPDSEDRT
jgi:hypothetical protein